MTGAEEWSAERRLQRAYDQQRIDRGRVTKYQMCMRVLAKVSDWRSEAEE